MCRSDLCGVGGIENAQPRKARFLTERLREYLRTETGATHAEQKSMGKFLALYLLSKGLVGLQLLAAFADAIEPAQPLILIRIRPQRFVAMKEAPHVALGAPGIEHLAHGFVKRARQGEHLVVDPIGQNGGAFLRHCAEKLVE